MRPDGNVEITDDEYQDHFESGSQLGQVGRTSGDNLVELLV